MRPLPSFGFYRVVGGDGIERLNQDPIQASDYATLLAALAVSDAKAHAKEIHAIAGRAYGSHGREVAFQYDRAMLALLSDPPNVLTRSYIEKYRVGSDR